MVTLRRNLRMFSSSRLSSVVSSMLPPPNQLSLFDTTNTDTLCSTLTSCLDSLCPLTSGPAPATPSAPIAYLRFSVSIAPDLGLQRGSGADRKILLTSVSMSLFLPPSSQMSLLLRPYTIILKSTAHLTLALFKTFSTLLCPPASPSSDLTADDFASFFVKKMNTISSQFSEPPLLVHAQTSETCSLPSFSLLSEVDVSKFFAFSQPTTCPLDPIPTHLKRLG